MYLCLCTPLISFTKQLFNNSQCANNNRQNNVLSIFYNNHPASLVLPESYPEADT